MKTTILAINERKSVIDDVLEELEKNDVEVLNKNLEFSLSKIKDSDFVLVRRDQRTPEIWTGVGYALGLNLPIIAFWNLKKEAPSYGFYGVLPITITETSQISDTLQKIENFRGKKNFRNFQGFQSPPTFYIAGDVRFADKTGYFVWMEEFLKRYAFNAINPQKLVDNYNPYENYCNDLSALPEENFKKVQPGKKGARYCLDLIDMSDGIITRVDDENNIGPWIETGYTIASSKPVIGIHKYIWPKAGKYEVVPDHAVDWEVIPEISNHNKQFGLNKWVAETQKDLIEILSELVSP
ncbi:MAG: hypothetical protein OH319_01220 [Candidatus Parvarchaeota archaeon]|nr:hypothetical protein [Candidatus Jingweiarchaeum tengchongense]MCW1297808.1 hypothetical protein [Candidatus Jingweiarchaeum tengchongense]MCW1299818.1 hypothetical protein [Candidatus Jingweiarchaeum tengchongense]MCW1304211.1 hypothetical protein [Candidatus Jingweiarchaeum tengchongense]MCW1305239.1 hypothetical protein [Candidatus Jingweiarchaeum tengchongense]